jgi:hypothetical protein
MVQQPVLRVDPIDHGRAGAGVAAFIFAGRLGQTIWSIGKALVVASGATSYWYMMTGWMPPSLPVTRLSLLGCSRM